MTKQESEGWLECSKSQNGILGMGCHRENAWLGCSHARGCKSNGDCAQEDGSLASNDLDAAHVEVTESDQEFEE